MSSSPEKRKTFNRDTLALWYFLGSLILGMLLLAVLLLKSYLL